MKQTLSIKQLACQNWQTKIDRSSRSQIFFKIGVLKNFAKFTRKQPCWSLFLITLQAWKPATLLKGDSNTGVFLWIWRIFKKSCFYRIPLVATSQQTILLVSEMSIFSLTLTCKKNHKTRQLYTPVMSLLRIAHLIFCDQNWMSQGRNKRF